MLKSLHARLTFLFAAFVLLVVVSVGAMLWGSETQRQDALLINLAGRQRMLAQQMTRLALEADAGGPAVRAALRDAETTFDQTLHALLDGGVAPTFDHTTVDLPPTRDPALRTALAQVRLTWDDFRTRLDALPAAPRDPAAQTMTLRSIGDESSTLVAQADAVVYRFETNATAKLNRLRAMQVGFLVAALGLLAAGAWVTHRSALAPLDELARAAAHLGTNDLDRPVHVSGPQEMQALAHSFDTMRQNLRASRAQSLDLMSTLETRVTQRTAELDALNAVTREITAQLDGRDVLNSVTTKARTLLDADAAMICLLDDSGQQLQLKAASGTHPLAIDSVRMSSANLAHAVLTSAQALRCHGSDCVGGCSLWCTMHAASHVVAPLRIGDDVIGALCVSSARPDHFSGEATDLVTKLANTAAVALHNAQLYAQAEKVAVLEERNRIAADMHDGLGQTLSYLGLVTDQTSELVAAGQDDQALAQLGRMRQAINQATRQVRASIHQLLDGTPHERRLSDQLRAAVAEFEERYRLAIQWQAEDGAWTDTPREVTEQVLNVTREALENACRHAGARSIGVCLGRENGHRFVKIKDDGCGFDPDALSSSPPGHFGLLIMAARAAHIGGELCVDSAPGAGTCVTLNLPVMETHP